MEIKILNYSKILNEKEELYEINGLGKLIYYMLFNKYHSDILLKVENENLNNLLNEILNNKS